jgi:hypothetical protein
MHEPGQVYSSPPFALYQICVSVAYERADAQSYS